MLYFLSITWFFEADLKTKEFKFQNISILLGFYKIIFVFVGKFISRLKEVWDVRL